MQREKKGRIRGILKFGVDPLTILVTALVTLSFGIIGSFLQKDTTWYVICDKGFYISLAVIILQTLIQNYFLKDDTDSLKEIINELNAKIKATECIVFPEKKSYINNRIEDALNSHIVRKMKIICYGTSKFGRIIDSIITTHISVSVDVVVCSPDEEFFNLKSDKPLLKNVIEELALSKNIRIFTSTTPPTIRASVMYDYNDKPIWCSMQPYYLFPDEAYKLFKGEGFSPSIIADTNNEAMLIHLIDVFNKEFERLMQKSDEVTTEKILQRRQNGTW